MACSLSTGTKCTPVRGEREAIGDPRRHALALGRLRRERCLGAGADDPPLVLRGAINHAAHELVGRRVAIALARGRHDARPALPRRTLDARREHDVAGNSVALRDNEHSRPVFAEGRQRRAEGGALLDGRHAADALIDVPGRDLNALAGGPSFDARPLRFRAKPLLVLRDANVGDRDKGGTGL